MIRSWYAEYRRDPRGLDVIEALAPEHSRYAMETKVDYFTLLWLQNRVLQREVYDRGPRQNCEIVGLDKLR